MRRFGGDCYAYCMLALGQIDIVAEARLKPYDIMPLIPIIEKAGGVVRNWDGGPAEDPDVHRLRRSERCSNRRSPS